MKTYKEMADSALKRIDEYEFKRKKRKKVITQVLSVVGCVCIALTAIVFLSESNIFNDNQLTAVHSSNTEPTTAETGMSTTAFTTENALHTQKNTTQKQTSEKATEQTTEKRTTSQNDRITEKTTTSQNDRITEKTTKSNTATTKRVVPQIPITSLDLEDWQSSDYVVWSDDGLKGSIDFAKPINKGGVAMTKELRDALDKHGVTRFYAVMVSFESSLPEDCIENIICDGKSVSELKKQADTLLKNGKNEDAHKIYVKIKEAKREYLLNYIDNFEDTFLKNGMRIFTESNGTTIDNMIFYCFASKISIENFKCKENEAFYFTLASRFK